MNGALTGTADRATEIAEESGGRTCFVFEVDEEDVLSYGSD
jgi:hypothetical protein